MFWFLIRILGIAGWAIILGLIVTLCTISRYDQLAIDQAYEREVSALHRTSIGQDPERLLPQERRATATARWVADQLEHRQATDGRVHMSVDEAMGHLPWGLWDTFKPRFLRFLPVLYLRIETYLTIYLTCLPLYFAAFLIGEHFARAKIRQGVHKRNIFPIWIRRMLWLIRDISVACTGLVIFPPVVWWVVPSVIISCGIIILWRAYSIQGLAFLTPGKTA